MYSSMCIYMIFLMTTQYILYVYVYDVHYTSYRVRHTAYAINNIHYTMYIVHLTFDIPCKEWNLLYSG